MISDEIVLDEDSHTYYWSGVKTPGVTEVISRTGISNLPDIEPLRVGRHRGTIVHKAIELLEEGKVPVEKNIAANPEFAALNIGRYVDAYKRFRDERIAKIVNSEMKVGHRIFRYCGKLDQLSMTIDGRLCIWDWKTGKLPWWVEIQTGAYLEAVLSMKDELQLESDEIWHGAVSLRPDGTYDAPRLSRDRSGFSIFRQALNIVNFTDRKRA